MAIPQIATSIFMLLLLLLSFFSTEISVVADDSVAMAKLASAFRPPPPSWSTNVSSSYCEWRYVLCDESKRVTTIFIQFHTMEGYLAPEIAGLSQLQVLSIKNNQLSGTIPLLNNLTCLTQLSLDGNVFTDIAPGFFQGLPATIQVLGISYNPIPPWTMPLDQLTRLSNLTDLELDGTNLLGPIPDIFQSLPLLRTLSLARNNLTGPLPPSLRTCKLEVLLLNDQGNGLSGTIDVLSNMTTLVNLQIDANLFFGPILDFSQHKSLETLTLDNNQLTGIIPPSLSSLSLGFFQLFNNKFLGPFPKFLLDDPYQAQGNNFCTHTGEPCDDQVTILLEIAGALGYPSLLVESWVGNDACAFWKFVICNSMKQIIEINFGDQRFGGKISPAFANLKALQSIYLHDNNLQGPIPESLMKLSHLQVLDISGNNLSGNIPAFSKSVQLNVSGNILLRYRSTKILKPHGDTQTQNGKSKGRRKEKIVLVVISSMGTVLGALCMFLLGKRVSRNAGKEKVANSNQEKANPKIYAVDIVVENGDQNDFEGIKMFNYEHLALATNNFASANKLGQGGFGPVYMGKLENGNEIAVKRLAGASGQGPEEFMNEVMVISKLQHRNLITLLGCCIEREENMLVYEYMPNKSLDHLLFDLDKRKLLDWRKRFSIIQGISQGLQYLHKDSRLRIVHRDLKASNILLDTDLNPKISDFGIAKVFTGTKDQGNTRRVMGTYGYMSPEYVLEGRFSQKSDVFSFGILVLEIVSGIRNGGLDSDNHSASLLEHAWGLWNEGNILSLIDPVIVDMSFHMQILRCIHVGLLCVQDLVNDRPTMSEVISMLKDENHEIRRLPAPKQPIFIEWKMATDHYSESGFSSAIAFSVTNGR